MDAKPPDTLGPKGVCAVSPSGCPLERRGINQISTHRFNRLYSPF